MAKKLQEIIIPKEKAVFWLDKNGFWHNKYGKFQHKKIIDYFHASIDKDKDGYYLGQVRDNYREKVYFHYEDKALFVFDVIKDNDITLVLNTKKQIKLKPKNLYIKDDNLYMFFKDDAIKFTEHSLMKISDLLKYEGDKYFIRIENRRYEIKKM
ncbi:MAG: MFS transporter permease [Desulfobacterales bacterium]|nr:MAG: MFS transporter permease [Desulfobacterales bacterium]